MKHDFLSYVRLAGTFQDWWGSYRTGSQAFPVAPQLLG